MQAVSITNQSPADRLQVIGQLREQLEAGCIDQQQQPAWPGPWPLVDRQLLAGGVRPGMMVDWVATTRGSAAGLLSLLAAARIAEIRERLLVVVDRTGQFYPPAAMAWGVDNRRLLVVRPQSDVDHLWALAQVLRSPAVAVVWATLGKIDSRSFRGLQLAAEETGTPAMYVRPAAVLGEPTWSHAQLVVTPQAAPSDTPRHGCQWVRLATRRLRGARASGDVVLKIDSQGGVVSAEPPPVAPPT
jgi:hypothetical protein